jgi:hypothetical protein
MGSVSFVKDGIERRAMQKRDEFREGGDGVEKSKPPG